MMRSHFLNITVPLQSSPAVLRQTIEAQLRQQGEPLRWAITAVDRVAQTAQIEAVVTQNVVTREPGA